MQDHAKGEGHDNARIGDRRQQPRELQHPAGDRRRRSALRIALEHQRNRQRRRSENEQAEGRATLGRTRAPQHHAHEGDHKRQIQRDVHRCMQRGKKIHGRSLCSYPRKK